MTDADNPYAALEALEVKARTSRKHEAKQEIDKGRRLVLRQDAAVRRRNYRGGAVFEFWYVLESLDGSERNLTRVEAQDLLDGYEPEPQAPARTAAQVAAPKSLQEMLDAPVAYTQHLPVVIPGDYGIQAQRDARTKALATLPDPEWWDARARYTDAGWHVSFERRIRRRE